MEVFGLQLTVVIRLLDDDVVAVGIEVLAKDSKSTSVRAPGDSVPTQIICISTKVIASWSDGIKTL